MSDYFSSEAIRRIEALIDRIEAFDIPDFEDQPQASEDAEEMVNSIVERLTLLRDKLSNEESMYEADE